VASRIPATAVLEHPFRQALLETIRREPGIAFLELYHCFRPHPSFGPGLGYGSLMYHLQQLERGRHITTRKSGRFRRHYEDGGPWNGATSALAVLQTPTAGALARIIQAWPGLCQQEVYERFRLVRPVTRQAVGYQLERLVALGLATMTGDGSRRIYHPTPLLERLLGFAQVRAEPSIPGAPCAECIVGPCVVALMPGERCPCATPGCDCHGPAPGCCARHQPRPPVLVAPSALEVPA
jgi:hypothetical protein